MQVGDKVRVVNVDTINPHLTGKIGIISHPFVEEEELGDVPEDEQFEWWVKFPHLEGSLFLDEFPYSEYELEVV